MKHIINGIEHVLAYLPNKKNNEGIILTTDLQCLLIAFDDDNGFYVSHEHEHLSFNTEYLLEPAEFVQLNAYLTRYYPSHITLDTLRKAVNIMPIEGDFGFTYTHQSEPSLCRLTYQEYDNEEVFRIQPLKQKNQTTYEIIPLFHAETLPYASCYLFATLLTLAEQHQLNNGHISGSLPTIATQLVNPHTAMEFNA